MATHFDNGVGEGPRRLLGQVVAYAPVDGTVRVLAGELGRVRAGIGVWRSVGIALEGNGGHGDDRRFGQSLFQIVVLRLAFGQALPPAVVVDDDGDVVGVI